uniref:NADH-ubiquinone oxidoreductase chain 5 n=1 Tax=Hoplobatrachus rugulosus TaxID=110072 RepID=K7N7U2_HOPRU|nr:NADH dehydrogenase subunit 5 [Hoplobatrachus rugulosus]ADG37205.1 NADH dehydrogenase subunit 5 [Hoplobatrachus rugulosus]
MSVTNHLPLTELVGGTFTVFAVLILLSPFFRRWANFHENTLSAMKTALYLSLVPLFVLIVHGADNTTKTSTSFPWFDTFCSSFTFWTTFDLYQIVFLPVALFVAGSILHFSTWYMHTDPKMRMFSAHLLIFLLAMILLISAGNLTLLFTGWEGVGIMSFLLIGWYSSRAEAATAALMAVIYNRVGDITFMAAFAWLIKFGGSSNLDYLFSHGVPTAIVIYFMVGAASKSAQFMFHPWLISAMEGPTPVSALLHSSTMVVAGVFLLLRLHPLLSNNPLALTICLCLGALTSTFAAWSATVQSDVKKIIALSTSSQLGLMMVAIGINLPNLAFFHMCTHAFFKAMLFLCSGVIIHNLKDVQDIRHMGGLLKSLPVTSACMTLGSLALMGTPYLIAFYSKDAIIEAATNSYVNSTALLFTLVATSFSALYSLRMIYSTLLRQPRTTEPVHIFEEPQAVKTPLLRLALGTIIGGPILFWILFPSFPKEATLPELFKWAALLITLTSFFVGLLVAWWYHWSRPPEDDSPYKDFDPALMERPIHRKVSDVVLDSAWEITAFGVEHAFWKRMGLDKLPSAQLRPIKILHMTHKGLIQLYLAMFFITLNEICAFLYVLS